MHLKVSHIQHFSVGDGPGIRTTIFLKGCNLHCPWCHNPETISGEEQTLYYEAMGRREVCGRKLSVEEILREVLMDRDFYTESGGGATISGGEALLQAEGVAILARSLKRENISVWLDTAGNVPWDAFERTGDWVDGYLYDYKAGTKEQYAGAIGGNLDLVGDNLRRLLAEGRRVRVRIPLIPGFNTDEASISLMCSNLRSLGAGMVDLLPFHRMGSNKYRALGLRYAYEKTPLLTEDEIRGIRQRYGTWFQTNVE